MHGVNLDQLGRRDPLLYGTLTLAELEQRIEREARELGMRDALLPDQPRGRVRRAPALAARTAPTRCCSTRARGRTTRGRSATRSRSPALPAVEVHLSDVQNREPWRRVSVLGELCFATVSGRGPDGYRDALALLREELDRIGEESGAA